MEKAEYQNMMSKFEEAGIKEFQIITDSDNLHLYNNEGSVIIPIDKGVVCFRLTGQTGGYMHDDSAYDFIFTEYEMIKNVKALGVTVEQGFKLMELMGLSNNEEYKNMIKTNPPRRTNNPGVGGQLKTFKRVNPETGEEETYIPKGMVGYVQ